MIGLLDSDILPYEIGYVLDETVSEGKVYHTVDMKIEEIRANSGSDSLEFYLTHSKSNFRNFIATVAPYKGHRPSEKPYHWASIRDYLISQYGAIEVRGYEADDIIADRAREDDETIICSRDKDLDTVPGWHFRWKCGDKQPERKYFVTPFEAHYFLHYQMLVGDQADNIKGIPGCGDKKAKAILSECETYEDLQDAVLKAYTKIIGEGSHGPIYYEDHNKNRYWRTPFEIMMENYELLALGTRYAENDDAAP